MKLLFDEDPAPDLIIVLGTLFPGSAHVHHYPPKVVWIRRGNSSTREIERILRDHVDVRRNLGESEEAGVLELR